MKQTLHSSSVTTTHRDLLAIEKDYRGIAVRFHPHFLHMLQINDRRTMNAKEEMRVQTLLKMSHGLPQQMRLIRGGDTHIVLLCADPSNFRHGQKDNATLRFEYDSARVSHR